MKAANYLLLATTIFITCISCSHEDRRVRIADNYYLMKNDLRPGYYLYFQDGEDFIERVPRRILEYGVDDNYIVVKCLVNEKPEMYIIDRKKDSRKAAPADYLLGPYSIEQFNLLRYPVKERIQMKPAEFR